MNACRSELLLYWVLLPLAVRMQVSNQAVTAVVTIVLTRQTTYRRL